MSVIQPPTAGARCPSEDVRKGVAAFPKLITCPNTWSDPALGAEHATEEPFHHLLRHFLKYCDGDRA